MIEEYNVDITYLAGKENISADFLSRCYTIKDEEKNDYYELLKELTKEQQKSVELNAKLMTYKYLDLAVDKDHKIIIPEKFVENYLNRMHVMLGHPGRSTMYYTIKGFINLKNLKKQIEKITLNCILCQKFKIHRSNYGMLNGKITTTIPFRDISTDVLGPFKTKHFQTTIKNSKFFILTITDRCTRFTEIHLIKDFEFNALKNKYNKWFKKFGNPNTLLSDSARYFIGNKFREFLFSEQIKPINSTAFNPTGNLLSERINQKITFLLAINKGESLNKVIYEINKVINRSVNRNTLLSPEQYALNYLFLDIFDKQSIDTRRSEITTTKANKENLEKLNKKRIKYDYSEGQSIFIKNFYKKDKLQENWLGPYLIVTVYKDYVKFVKEKKIHKVNKKFIRPCLQKGKNVVKGFNFLFLEKIKYLNNILLPLSYEERIKRKPSAVI